MLYLGLSELQIPPAWQRFSLQSKTAAATEASEAAATAAAPCSSPAEETRSLVHLGTLPVGRALSRVLKYEPDGQRVPSHQVSALQNHQGRVWFSCCSLTLHRCLRASILLWALVQQGTAGGGLISGVFGSVRSCMKTGDSSFCRCFFHTDDWIFILWLRIYLWHVSGINFSACLEEFLCVSVFLRELVMNLWTAWNRKRYVGSKLGHSMFSSCGLEFMRSEILVVSVKLVVVLKSHQWVPKWLRTVTGTTISLRTSEMAGPGLWWWWW